MTPSFWNADRETIRGRGYRYKVGVGMRNFRKPGMSWSRISNELNADRSGNSLPADSQFGMSSQDWHDMLFSSSFSMKRYQESHEQDNSEPSLSAQFMVETAHNVGGAIEDGYPSQVRYRNAWDGADLRVGIWFGAAARIEKVVEVHTLPSGSDEFVEYSFQVRLRGATLHQRGSRFMDVAPGNEKDLTSDSVFVSQSDSELRGFVIRRPVCWWYNEGELVERNVRVRIRVQPDGETLRITKYIPRAWMVEALQDGSFLRTDATFQPDADPEVNSMDFWTQRSVTNQTWSQMTNGNGNGASASQTRGYIRMRSMTTTNKYNLLNRCNQLFDTSSLTGIADSGTLSVRMSSKSDPSGYWTSDLGVFGTSTTNVTAPTIGDFQLAGTTSFATPIAYGSVSTSVYNVFTLNAAGLAAVDVSGITGYVTALSTYDLGGSTPTWYSNINHNFRQWQAEQGASYAPEIDITTAAPTNTPAALLL
jgi:hypothetical protein